MYNHTVAALRPLPEWLGKRPPGEGNWELTLDENFDGETLNREVWDIPDLAPGEGVHPMLVDGAKSWWGIRAGGG